MQKLLLIVTAVVLGLAACGGPEVAADFVTVEDGHFMRAGEPYYYVGTNFWYGAILGSEEQGLNSVFLSDTTTLRVIRESIIHIHEKN